MTYRMRNILIAVALAGFAALLVTFYISNYKSERPASAGHGHGARGRPRHSREDTLGTDVVAKGMLTTQQVPRAAVVPGAISSPDQIKYARRDAADLRRRADHVGRFGPSSSRASPGQITATAARRADRRRPEPDARRDHPARRLRRLRGRPYRGRPRRQRQLHVQPHHRPQPQGPRRCRPALDRPARSAAEAASTNSAVCSCA